MQINKIAEDKYQVKIKDAAILLDESGVEIEGLKFTGPGEYERKGVFVDGVQPDGEGAVFVIHAEEISLCYLGKISKLLSGEAVKALGDIDILFVPMGRSGSLKPADAEKTISTIDPRIVIPIFVDDGLNLESALGMSPEKVDSYKTKKAELPQEDRKLIII